MAQPEDAVTGAFGYTGRHITTLLLQAGRAVRNLTGHPGRPDPFGGRLVTRALAFDDPAALTESLRGVHAFYLTYWIRFARGGQDHRLATQRCLALVAAAARAGVQRLVYVSITGADPRSPLPYFRGKGEVEQALRQSGLSYGIVRPTLLFGGGDVLINNIAWILRRYPVFLVPGTGAYPVQPVAVQDVAALAVQAGRSAAPLEWDAAGPQTFSYAELVRAIGTAIGMRRTVLPAAPALVHLLGTLLGWSLRDVVLTRQEIAGLMAGLLVSADRPRGTTRLSHWLKAHAGTLGIHWASELDRHYRQP